ncbi:MAG: lysophospholipase [Adhaeribacter sp.]|nr:lysophospholipase [Adhaeribacter sp.]
MPYANDRRSFLKKAALGSLLTIGLPEIITSAMAAQKTKKVTLKQDAIILFQGDSITDAGRKKDNMEFNNPSALGSGYAFLAASDLLLRQASKNLRIYNKGISGNKVYQMADRWETDALALKPDVLSIMIGVNDFWHTLTNNYTGTIQTYRDDYKKLLDRTKQQLPEVKLIIGEPFGVTGIKSVTEKWYPAFNEYRQVSREMADAYGAAFIPYQSIFDKALKAAPGVYWTYDGVHPSLAGARLMAEAWLETIKT